jgi:hypothetical protein
MFKKCSRKNKKEIRGKKSADNIENEKKYEIFAEDKSRNLRLLQASDGRAKKAEKKNGKKCFKISLKPIDYAVKIFIELN